MNKTNRQNTAAEVRLFKKARAKNPNKLIYFILRHPETRAWCSMKLSKISDFYTTFLFYSLKHPNKEVLYFD